MPRNPDTPCVKCGKLLWTGTTSASEPICRPCRREAGGWNRDIPIEAQRDRTTWVPDSRDCRTCGTNFLAMRPTQVYCNPRCRPNAAWRDKPRNPVKYGPAHTAARRDWAKRLNAAGQLPCSICGGPVFAGSKWHLDHVPDTNDQYRGVAHPQCNISEGARRGVQKANRSPKRARRDSLPLTLASGRTVNVDMRRCEACGKTCFGVMCRDCRNAQRRTKPVSFGDQLALIPASSVDYHRQRVSVACEACGTVTMGTKARRFCSSKCSKKAWLKTDAGRAAKRERRRRYRKTENGRASMNAAKKRYRDKRRALRVGQISTSTP